MAALGVCTSITGYSLPICPGSGRMPHIQSPGELFAVNPLNQVVLGQGLSLPATIMAKKYPMAPLLKHF